MNAPSDPTARAGDLVLELFRKRQPGAEDAFDFLSNLYLRRREGQPPREATIAWGRDLKNALDALFVDGEQALSAEAKARAMGGVLRTFLGDLGWEETEKQILDRLAARGDGPPVPLTLRLGASELFALPWELLRFSSSETQLGRQSGLILRYEQLGALPAKGPVTDPPPEGGRILFAWSDAGGDVDAKGHVEALCAASGMTPSQLETGSGHEVLPRASLDAIDDALTKRPAAVLHLLCHGAMRSYRENGRDKLCSCLVLHDRDGRRTEVTPIDLHTTMSRHAGSLRLVVLSVCRGGDRGDLDNTLGSPAQQIHAAGVPAVVAARYLLPIDDSIALTRSLYEQLLRESRSLEEAFSRARESLRAHPLSWSSLQLFARAADGPDHRPFIVKPYRGLRVLTEKDQAWFFGRGAETQAAVAALGRLVGTTAGPTGPLAASAEGASPAASPGGVGHPRLLVVSGASSAGNSSFVAAGVVPAWVRERTGTFREAWSVHTIPDGRPNLAALAPAEAARGGSANVLLWIDQLEGAFSSGVLAADREAFFQRIWALARDPASRVTVLATVRADFLDRLGEIRVDAAERTLEEIARDPAHGLPLFRMKSAALRELVEGPAARAGIEIEPGLCDRLVRDVGDSAGAQALLEYVLPLLWERRTRCGARLAYGLTHHAYMEIGGISEALNRRADQVIDALSPVQQRAARRLLVQLVEVDGGGADRRKRVACAALQRGPDDEAQVRDEVLAALAAAELVVVDEVPQQGAAWGREIDDVELSHDELLRSWKRLRAWLDEDRQKKLSIQQIERWAEELSGVPDATLVGAQLDRARLVLREHADEMLPRARALVDRSIEASERAAREAEAAKQRELDQLRRSRDLAILGGAREILSRGEAGAAGLLLCEISNPETATPGGQLARVAREVLDAGVPLVTLRGHTGPLSAVAADPANRCLLTGAEDGTVRLWQSSGAGEVLATYKGPVRIVVADPFGRGFLSASDDGTAHLWPMPSLVPRALEPHAAPVVSARLDRAGQRILTASADGVVRVLDAATGRRLTVFQTTILPLELRSVVFCPVGKHIAALDAEGGFHVWTDAGQLVERWPPGTTTFACLSSERFLLGRADGDVWLAIVGAEGGARVLGQHAGRVVAAVANLDGSLAVTTGADGTAGIWRHDAPSGACQFVRSLSGHDGPALCADISADGKRVATGGQDGTARVFAVDDVEAEVVLRRHFAPVRALLFSGDGRFLVTASEDRTARVWRRDGSNDPRVLRGHTDTTTAVDLAPDGGRALSGSLDCTARVWDLAGTAEPIVLAGHRGPVRGVAWSPDGRRVATASDDGSARIWGAGGGGAPVVLGAHPGPVRAVAFHPDGQRLITGAADGAARLWDASGSGAPLVLPGHTRGISGVAWSPSGDRVITASEDGTARIWSVDRPGDPPVILAHEGPLSGAVFSPDGLLAATVLPGTGVCVWRADGAGAPQLAGGRGGARCAAFTAGDDGDAAGLLGFFSDVAVWQMQKGKEWFVVVKGHGRPLTSAAFSRDLRLLATTSEDRTVRVYAIAADLLQQRLREATRDCLLPSERQTWLGETETQAHERFAACETGKGRTPATGA